MTNAGAKQFQLTMMLGEQSEVLDPKKKEVRELMTLPEEAISRRFFDTSATIDGGRPCYLRHLDAKAQRRAKALNRSLDEGRETGSFQSFYKSLHQADKSSTDYRVYLDKVLRKLVVEKKYLTVFEAAKLLRLPQHQVWFDVKFGRLITRNDGGETLIATYPLLWNIMAAREEVRGAF